MAYPVRHALFLALAVTFNLTTPSSVGASPENTLAIIVDNGPHAGTYRPPTESIICLHAKKQKRYTAAWKDFDAHDNKALAEAGINVSNPDAAGAKQGEVRIAFGDPDKKPTIYSVDRAPLTFMKAGTGAEITFQGKTKEGIQLRVKAICLDVEEM